MAAAPIKIQPLWVRVDENRIKLAAFVSAFVVGSALLLTLALIGVPGLLTGFAAEYAELWPLASHIRALLWVMSAAFGVALAIGFVIALAQLRNAEDWVRCRFGGEPLDAEKHKAFVSAVHDMSLAAGLKESPRLEVIGGPGINAVAVGTTRKRPLIGVTRSLLEDLPAEQQRAVIAVMIARIKSGDILFGTALAALMGPLKAIREARASGLAPGPDSGCVLADTGCSCADGCLAPDAGCSSCGEGCGCLADGLSDADSGCLPVVGVVLFVAVTIALTYAAVVAAAWIVTLWGRVLHRTAYEKADAEGMLLLKDPEAMAAALHAALSASSEVATDDASYDGILYAAASGRAGIDARERRRYERLLEVLGTDGTAIADTTLR